jgi:hypothetical protein
MTRRVGNVLIIEGEEDNICELCGNEAETRPYGPNGENVCFPCGMKDEAAAVRQFAKRLSGIEPNME